MCRKGSGSAVAVSARWMPASRYPLTTTGNKVLVVQPQRLHRCPPHGSHANDLAAIVAPTEMFRPPLRPGVEQRNFIACNRINPGDLCSLETVAPGAREPQVGVIGSAAQCQRHDMLDMHRGAADSLRCLAVATTMFSKGGYPTPYGPWNVSHRLVLSKQRPTPA